MPYSERNSEVKKQVRKTWLVTAMFVVVCCMLCDFAVAGLSLHRYEPAGKKTVNDLEKDGNSISFVFGVEGRIETPDYNKEKYEPVGLRYRWSVPRNSPGFKITSTPGADSAEEWGEHSECTMCVTYVGSGHGGDRGFTIDVEAVYALNEKGTGRDGPDEWEEKISIPIYIPENLNPNQAHFGEWVVGEQIEDKQYQDQLAPDPEPEGISERDPSGELLRGHHEWAYNEHYDGHVYSGCKSEVVCKHYIYCPAYTWSKGNTVETRQTVAWKGTREAPPYRCPKEAKGEVIFCWRVAADMNQYPEDDDDKDGLVEFAIYGRAIARVAGMAGAPNDYKRGSSVDGDKTCKESDDDTYSLGTACQWSLAGPSVGISLGFTTGDDTFDQDINDNYSGGGLNGTYPVHWMPPPPRKGQSFTILQKVHSYTAAKSFKDAHMCKTKVTGSVKCSWEDAQ